MDFTSFIRQYFTLATLSRLVENRAPVESPVFARIFSTRVNRAVDRINLAQITRKTKAMPVISRGGKAIPIDPKNVANTYIEPMSIRLSDWITGSDLNGLRALYGADGEGADLVKAELDRMTMDLMESTERTRNALCAQALTGDIDYQMEGEGGKERYQINYGKKQTATVKTKIDVVEGGKTMTNLIAIIKSCKKKINENGFSGQIEAMAGSTAFGAICDIISVAQKDGNAQGATFDLEKANVQGITIYGNDATYADKDGSGKEIVKNEIPEDDIVVYAKNCGELDYCAIDDVTGKLQATPFFAKILPQEDPSGYKVISESKPLPLVAVKAICWATVTGA